MILTNKSDNTIGRENDKNTVSLVVNGLARETNVNDKNTQSWKYPEGQDHGQCYYESL